MQEFTLLFSSLFEEEGWQSGKSIDLRDIESTNCYCDASSADLIRERLKEVNIHALHWIDSGDYHYATLFFAERISRPFNLFLIDNHSDDFEPGTLSCGNWVSYVRKLPLYRPQPSQDLPVYVSLDLDALDVSEFSTNWDQGHMTAQQMLEQVLRTAEKREILGMDICGGLTRAKGACDCQLENNRKTREFISQNLCNSVF